MKFRIVGPRRVCGFDPGDTVEESDLDAANVAHLIQAGHIAPLKKLPSVNVPEDSANDGEEQQ